MKRRERKYNDWAKAVAAPLAVPSVELSTVEEGAFFCVSATVALRLLPHHPCLKLNEDVSKGQDEWGYTRKLFVVNHFNYVYILYNNDFHKVGSFIGDLCYFNSSFNQTVCLNIFKTLNILPFIKKTYTNTKYILVYGLMACMLTKEELIRLVIIID